METIRTCPKHRTYIVPLLFTVKFPKKEHYCPYCGTTYEFHQGVDMPKNEQLVSYKAIWQRLCNPFLRNKFATDWPLGATLTWHMQNPYSYVNYMTIHTTVEGEILFDEFKSLEEARDYLSEVNFPLGVYVEHEREFLYLEEEPDFGLIADLLECRIKPKAYKQLYT